MKYQLLFLLSFLAIHLNAQDITGDWYGAADVMGQQLRLVFHISQDGDTYTSTMDSPDQGAKDIPVQETIVEKENLTIKMPEIKFVYEGKVNADFTKIEGNITQGGFKLPLTLKRDAIEKKEVIRPQDPKAPFPYHVEEVKYRNIDAGIHLAGTLTLPSAKGQYPVAILISGSGPQDRNEEILGHKPFLVLADHLTRNGIGVLRFDDRGVGESTGDHDMATSASFASDVKAGIAYLKSREDVDSKKIGLIGHSEGGMIAPMVAARSKDVSYIVLLAGPGIDIPDLLLLQQEAIGKAQGTSQEVLDLNKKTSTKTYKVLKEQGDSEKMNAKLDKLFRESVSTLSEKELKEVGNIDVFVQNQIKSVTSPWFKFFINYKPDTYLSQVKCPVLAINGTKDLQVTYKENLTGIETSLKNGKCKNYEIKELEDLNHLFQHSKTGNPAEYGALEETFAVEALDVITAWLQAQVK